MFVVFFDLFFVVLRTVSLHFSVPHKSRRAIACRNGKTKQQQKQYDMEISGVFSLGWLVNTEN